MNRINDLSVQQLRTFQVVISEGGYSAASRSLGISVPAVWQHIRAIEKAYGATFFKKRGRRVEPTEAALKLHDVMSHVLAELESTADVVHDSTDDYCRPISIVVGVRMMLEDLTEPLKRFRKQFDNRLTIHHGNDLQAREMVASGEADIGVSLRAGPSRELPQIHSEPAYDVDFMAVAPKNHPYAQAASGGLRELSNHKLIVTKPGTHGRDALEQALHREELSVDISIETDNSAFTIACVQAGMGLGILAGRADGQLCRKLAVRSLRRQLGRRRIVFIWKKGRRLTRAIEALLDEIRKIGG